jgi:hypothetical protein
MKMRNKSVLARRYIFSGLHENNLSITEMMGLILLVVSVCYSYYTVNVFKLFYRDSIWVASYAYHFVKEGVLLDVIAREPGMALAHGRIHDLLYGNVMVLLEDVVFSHRYISWFLSILSLILYYLLSIRLGYEKKVAIYATLFMSITEHFLLSAHIARSDMLAFLLVLLVLYLMARDKPSLLLRFIAGGLSAIAIDVHLSTQYVLFMLLGYEISKDQLDVSFVKNTLLRYRYFIVGYLAGLMIVVMNNIDHLDLIISSVKLLDERAINIDIINRLSWIFTFGFESTYGRWLFYPALVVLVVYLYFSSVKRNDCERKSWMIFVGGYIGFLLLGRMNHHYIILFIVFLYQIILFKTIEENNKIAGLFLVLSVIMFIGIQAYVVARDGGSDIEEYQKKVRNVVAVQEDVVVIAPDDLWLIYKSNKFHGYHTRGDIEKVKSREKVLFISNEIHSRFLTDGTVLGKSTGVEKYGKDFMSNFTKIAEVKDEHYGGFGITKNNTISFYSNY